jgi:pseudoazurin
MPNRLKFGFFTLFVFVIFTSSNAFAAEHVIKMLNDDGKGNALTFSPDFLQVAVGDTIKIEPTDPGHNAETIPEIWPKGAPQVHGELGKEVTFTVDKDGVYGIKCLPHFAFGMMALIVAGKPVNADEVDGFQPPAMAKTRFDALKAKLEAVQ